MKREIKFRAWDKKGREMWGISSIAFGRNDEILWLDLDKEKAYPMENVNPDQVELMQYTGLKDKNGKEIWEGDIMHLDFKSKVLGRGKGAVKFKGGTFGLEFENDSFWPFLANNDADVYEVIGNLYENPELLKEEK